MAKKTTKAQRLQRVRDVYEKLLFDTPRPDILQYCYGKWGVSEKTVDNYIKSANELIITEVAEMRQNSLEKHITQRTLIARQAMQEGDGRLALEVLRDLAKLEGLYPSGKLEITTKDITDEQRVNRITTLLDGARERRTGLAN